MPSEEAALRSTMTTGRERAALVGLFSGTTRQFDPEHSLDELAGLASAAGAAVVLRVLQDRPKPDPATFLGSGKVATLARSCEELDADVVIFDNELSPAQLRNLEKALDRKVLDRTQLILDIFARRARTREGKLQVELAQLKYLLPRLVGASTALSRLGGGIGTRGPGETKLETDRRRIRHRISVLSKEIDLIRRRRQQSRERRHKAAVPIVALVGYTNAGKTTLFNTLTGDAAVASDALFVTLDPLVRKVRLPDRRELLVSDTVGFIERLPHSLVAAFRATLEELTDADLLVQVVDLSDPDRIICLPGHKRLKLSPDAIQLTGATPEEKVSLTVDKFYAKPNGGEVGEVLPLAELIFLEDGADFALSPISGSDRLIRMQDDHQTSCLFAAARRYDQAAQFAHMIRLARQIRMACFVRPRNLDRFDEGIALVARHVFNGGTSGWQG